MNAIETELLQYEALNTLTGRGQEPVDVENADLHFHMRFSRAVQKCNIYETDANWHSANSYATTVLNRVVEDVHYLAFEGIGSASRVSVCSDGAPIQRMQIDGMAGRMNTYKRMYCTGIVASQLTTRFVQRNGRDVFLGRVARCGFRPVPTAPEYDDGLGEDELEKAMEHAWSDVSIRAELHGLIMALVPYTTTESTMLMMQRAIEVYNKTIVSYLAGIRGGLDGAFGAPLEGQGISPQVLDPIREGNGAVSVAQISKLAQWLADLWFDRLKRGLLRALMADCQLRPVSLASVRRWIAEDRAPGGKGIDFVLNTRLYTYLKHLRVRMNEAKWLYASAAATLRVIERAKERLTTPHLLDHVSVSRCAEQFRAQIANELRLDSPVGPAKARMPELDISPLEAAILGRTGDTSSAMSHDSPENLARELEESRMRLDQLALTAASAPPPPLVIPLSPKATESSRVDSRLEFLELEVASIRREMHGVADMRRDVSAILAMLRGQPAR
ncbi:hypothetical protein IWW55_005992 [Coemansia sp. RSA 2706]|nr:hypothetical protein IWW55_005992 [Coemansia sp. RSA 2706]